jgi:uncharacterized protein (TIGR03790 family)
MKKLLNRSLIATIYILLLINGVIAQKALYRVVQYNASGEIDNEIYQESLLDEPENVLVLYNIEYLSDENNNSIWDGFEVAEYYKTKRNIPELNIQGIKAPITPDISRAQYDTFFDQKGEILGIRQQVENILTNTFDENGTALKNKIKYIVLTKGIPYRIKTYKSSEYLLADYSSVDAAIAIVFNGNYNINWWTGNPYYNQDPQYEGLSPFIPLFYTNSSALQLCYLVTRLDGYSVQDIKRMIDRSVKTDSLSRNNYFILDGAQKPYDRMDTTYSILKHLGASLYPDPWVDDIDPILSSPDSVIGIVTHGTHAGLEPDYIQNQFDFKLADGSIFSSYESINGRNFDPNVQNSQGQIADFIHIGGSGGIGNVDEPYAAGMADESVLFPAYYSGYTFAEAAYMSMPYVDWINIVIGDPLMRIAPKINPQIVHNFRVIIKYPVFYTIRQSTNTVAQISFTENVDTTRLPYFYSEPGDIELKPYVDKNFLYLYPASSLPENTVIHYKADKPIYSINGDSIWVDNFAVFWTHNSTQDPVAPVVYRATPTSINIDTSQNINIFFSQKMIPETIYPLLGNNSLPQTHNWINNCILDITHPAFTIDTLYSFYIDEHAKSIDNIGLAQKFYFSFETEKNYIAFDIDKDGFDEYALDLNGETNDGFEYYLDTLGTITSVVLETDLDTDNQVEFILKNSNINQPLYYWNPSRIPETGYYTGFTAMDDDEDEEPEYAFDATGIGYFTNVYDPNDENKIRNVNLVLIKTSPSDQSINVNPSINPVFEFSLPINTDQITESIDFAPEISIKSIYSDLNGRRIKIYPTEPFIKDTSYTASISENLTSINDVKLLHDYRIIFNTAERDQSDKPVIGSDLVWQQSGDFLKVYLLDSLYDVESYELYLTNKYLSSLDSLNLGNLYLSSKQSAWFIDLNSLAEKVYLYLKINYSDNHCWSNPMIIYNYVVDQGDNLSLPVTIKFPVDSISLWQNNIQSISQWDALNSEWKSAKQIGEENNWSLSFQMEENRGLMLRSGKKGHLAWVQSIPDTIIMRGSGFETGHYCSIYNPHQNIYASELASEIGNASHIAEWDNYLQGWNEAIYDSVSQTWINNFQIDHMTPVYALTNDSFYVAIQLEKSIQNRVFKNATIHSNTSDTNFPSCTKILHFPIKIGHFEIYRGEEKIDQIAGCGLESDLNIAFINVGNLNKENMWKFVFYNEAGQIVDTYIYNKNEAELINLPESFEIDSPYPNPFNSTVTLPIHIPKAGSVQITIYNILGQQIYSDKIEVNQPQLYRYKWTGQNSTGLYITRIQFDKKILNAKVILIK